MSPHSIQPASALPLLLIHNTLVLRHCVFRQLPYWPPRRCKVCPGTLMLSPVSLAQHLASKRHIKKLGAQADDTFDPICLAEDVKVDLGQHSEAVFCSSPCFWSWLTRMPRPNHLALILWLRPPFDDQGKAVVTRAAMCAGKGQFGDILRAPRSSACNDRSEDCAGACTCTAAGTNRDGHSQTGCW